MAMAISNYFNDGGNGFGTQRYRCCRGVADLGGARVLRPLLERQVEQSIGYSVTSQDNSGGTAGECLQTGSVCVGEPAVLSGEERDGRRRAAVGERENLDGATGNDSRFQFFGPSTILTENAVLVAGGAVLPFLPRAPRFRGHRIA